MADIIENGTETTKESLARIADNPSAQIRLKLLGGFCATHPDENAVSLSARKGEALIAYLALNQDQRHTREKLATLLWGDRFDAQARHSLRQTVRALRQALADEDASIIVSTGEFLCLRSDAFEVDALEFQELSLVGSQASLERAIALYSGDLLEGLTTKSAGFEEWLSVERVRFRGMAVEAHSQLMRRQADLGASEAAISSAQRLLTLDPSNDMAHRLLMELYDASGKRSAALRQFRSYEDLLRREFGAEPDPDMSRLYEEIRVREERKDLPLGQAEAEEGGTQGDKVRMGEDLVLPSPNRPSIVVLPFKDLAHDDAPYGLAAGMTEEITTALSMLPGLFVIAYGSAYAFKGEDLEIHKVAKEFGARYILEGGLQCSGARARISVRLIDAFSGDHLWGERYDREIGDVFALQDEITLNVVSALEIKLTEGEYDLISVGQKAEDLQAWLLVGQGMDLLRSLTKESNAKARGLFDQAVQLDPEYARAWVGLAWSHFMDARSHWSASRRDSLRIAAELGEKALALDRGRPRTYSLLSNIRLLEGRHDEAVSYGEKAVALNPNGSEVGAFLAFTLTYTGDLERSVSLMTHAIRLRPYHPPWYSWTLGRAYRLMGRYEGAVAALTFKLDESKGAVWPRVELAAAYSEMGRLREAAAQAEEVMKIDPGYSVGDWAAMPHYTDRTLTEHEAAVLREAGLPE